MAEKAPGVIKKLDEAVINRIAAGEVIQRPANALKELVENSLDAGGTSITVVVSGGGLQLLQITDNGSGIRKEDLDIVCERFTTSKLRHFNDLTSIGTYGFRGEALASISHVAKLTILTKTHGQQCGYKVEYSDGKPTSGKPKPCAANQGTQITVEDLFYNVPTRKRVLKSPSDEFNRIADVVTKYAIHNSGKAGFTLKKVGDSGNDLRTQCGNSVPDNVANIFSPAIAKELLEFSHENSALKFKANGYFTNPNYNVKKMNFLLFINHRLVESSALKKSIEMVYSAYLPKGTHPFVYLSLEIAPENVDVNVHPTKHEVHFLHQDDIIEKLQQSIDARLLGSNTSRTFYTQPLLPGATIPTKAPKEADAIKSVETSAASSAPKHMIRTDSRDQKMDKFVVKTNNATKVLNETVKSTVTVLDSPSEKVRKKQDPSTVEPMDTDEPVSSKTKRDIKLGSVRSLKKSIEDNCHPGLRDLIANHSFVGCADREFALIQHSTKLYAVNTSELTHHLFYQLMLGEFGNAGYIKLNPPAKISDMVRMALDMEEAGWTELDGEKDALASGVVDLLIEKAEMLDDYFSLEISSSGELTGIPLLLEGYVPDFNQLPMLLLRLATEVNWTDEEACFDTFCEEMARFYKAHKISQSSYTDKQHDKDSNEDEKEDCWKNVMEQAVFPAMKKMLKPPKKCADNKTFNMVANLPDLYKVFERC